MSRSRGARLLLVGGFTLGACLMGGGTASAVTAPPGSPCGTITVPCLLDLVTKSFDVPVEVGVEVSNVSDISSLENLQTLASLVASGQATITSGQPSDAVDDPGTTLQGVTQGGATQGGGAALGGATASGSTGATPSGYRLRDPGYRRSDFVYDSYYIDQVDLVYRNGGAHVRAATQVQLHERVVGGSSKNWDLTYNARTAQNNDGLTWTYGSLYYCGVNVANADDHICEKGAAPSKVDEAFNPGDVRTKRFEDTSGNTVFPMLQLSTHFSSGVTVDSKFRGYDTLNRAQTTRLNTSSGTGR